MLNKFILLTVSIMLFLAVKLQASDKSIVELRDSINKYYYSFDEFKLREFIVKTDKLLSEAEENKHILQYYSGTLRYCYGRVIYNKNRDKAYEIFDESLDLFIDAWEENNNPIYLAMQSAAYGKKSALSPLRAIFFGQKAKNRIYDAFNLDSNSSKILLVAATHLMHIPSFYGGDKDKARRLLLKCLELNKQKITKDIYELDWASDAEIYAYLAQIDILEDNLDSAEKYIQAALNLKPNYGFVKIDLRNQISDAGK
ncbi:MAG: hypothetical protein WCZ17_04995 [Candidatus Kapaibacterium sp.]|nr:hypothetical protein [Candidatus Kapabacteria bacterium]